MADLIKKVKIMQQDGTFTDYIPLGADAINVKTEDGISVENKLNKKPYYYNTIADMKADTKLKVGDMAITLGYYEPNDGGNGEYRIIEGVYEDDGGSYHKLENNLYAELLIKNNIIYIKQFGIKGDGITDETEKINTFFEQNLDYNKIINDGTYLITSPIYIKGKWRRDINKYPQIVFENATFLYSGVENGYSIILYNMFKYNIKGLSVARNSVKNIVQIVGCWHLQCSDWDIQTLDISDSDANLINKTYAILSSEYISLINCYMLGYLQIKSSSPNYINCVNFYNTIIYSSGYDYCVKLMGNNAKQEINFYNSDLSYSTKSIFYIDETQIGGCTVNCIGSYFDSARKIFYNDDQKNIEFNNFFTMMPANSNAEITNIAFSEWIKNCSLGGYNQFGYNLPTANVNYAINGNMSTNSQVDGDYGFLMGLSSDAWTKEYVNTNLSPSGRARKITNKLTQNQDTGIDIKCLTAPRDGLYTAYIRAKIVAGSCDNIQIAFGDKYITTSTSRFLNKEFVLVNSKNVTRQTGQGFNFAINFSGNVSSDLAIEFYEVGVVDGKMYIPNIPLHENAKL